MAKKIFYVSRTEDPQTGTAGAATLNRADQPQLMKVYDTVADAEADIANIDTNEIVGTKEVDLSSYTIVNRVADGNLNPVTSNAVANALSYSTEETLTGGTWIDGKPIYRKVFSGDTWTTDIDVTSLNVDQPVKLEGLVLRIDVTPNAWKPFSGSANSSSYTALAAYAANGHIGMEKWNISVSKWFVVFEYTKTGD